MHINKKHKKQGFTLIELIVVIAILAILVALALPTFNGLKSEANNRVCEANRHSLKLLYQTLSELKSEEQIDLQTFLNGEYDTFKEDVASTECPENGVFSAKNGAILCSIHGDSSNTGTPSIPNDNNYEYDYVEYDKDATYSYGEIVSKDGILYRCLKPGNTHNPPNSHNATSEWEIVGTVDGSAVEFQEKRRYASGTMVHKDGEYYMYTPIYNDSYGYTSNNHDLNNSFIWTTIKPDSTYVKPDKYDTVYNDVEDFPLSDKLVKGQYYRTTSGQLYLCNADNVYYSGSVNYNDVNTEKLTAITNNQYIYNNAKYNQGDVIWYMGSYYKAKQTFTTYNQPSHSPSAQNNQYWELV